MSSNLGHDHPRMSTSIYCAVSR